MAGDNRRRSRRKAAIFAASILFHLALFFIAFSRASGDLVSAGDAGGGPQGPVFAVTLVRLPSPVPAPDSAMAAQPDSPFLKLRPTARTDGIVVAVATEADRFAALAERLALPAGQAGSPTRRFAANHVQPQGAYVPDDTRLSDARSRKARTDQGTEGETSGSASTGSLWGAIEPCWQNLGFRGQVPVTIDVALDGRGALRGPPQVVRSTTALLSEPRLKSEANALAALAACMPKGEVRLASNRYRLEFPATP
jgi:hypothetical protein